MIKTCEFVSPMHPDKYCDFIADSILDAYMKVDPKSRTAPEIQGGHKLIVVNGEITSHGQVDIESIVRKLVPDDYKVLINIVPQSPQIAQGVDPGGAGDQGIMMGYAFRETETLMPFEYEQARKLCQYLYQKYPFDGKVQVTVDGKKIMAVVASFQNVKTPELEKEVRGFINSEEYFINPSGDWDQGWFDADTGLSGRKIVIDNYGPEHSVGGGSFSGKDYTKVDRSGAYMARKIAVSYLQKYNAEYVRVKLAYAIGKSEALMSIAEVDGKEMEITDFDVKPGSIKEQLNLARPIFVQTSQWGHFGRGFEWDKPSS